MRKLLCILFVSFSLSVNAQINVGSNEIPTMNNPGKLSAEDFNTLKSTTTLFTLQYSDYKTLEAYEKVIASVWKVTKFRIIKPDETDKYMQESGYSFFSFGGYYTTHGSSSNLHSTYDLWMPHVNKKGNIKGSDYYARIYLSPDAMAYQKAVQSYGTKFSEKMINYLYNDAVFFNWNAGFLKGYLKTVNDLLMQQETMGPFSSYEENSLAKLKRDTLYIPDYVNDHYNPFTGADNVSDEEADEKDIRDSYPYRVKYVTVAKLNEILLNATKPIYYLVYVRSSTDKYVNVYSSETGMIYARYKAISYNFKNKDLGFIAKAIKQL